MKDYEFDKPAGLSCVYLTDGFGATLTVAGFFVFLVVAILIKGDDVAKKTAIRIPHQECPHEVDLGYTHVPKTDSEGGLRVTVAGESIRLHLCDHDLILSRDGAKLVGQRLIDAARHVDDQRAKKKNP
jgi:hypothetical protein